MLAADEHAELGVDSVEQRRVIAVAVPPLRDAPGAVGYRAGLLPLVELAMRFQGAVEEDRMGGVDAALDRLGEIAGLGAPGRVQVSLGTVHELKVRQLRLEVRG